MSDRVEAPIKIEHELTFAEMKAGNYLDLEAMCPSCGHQAWLHDIEAGCMVESWGDYCPCGRAPTVATIDNDPWPMARSQDKEDDEE